MNNQIISIENNYSISLSIKREDLNHQFISGNKLRKMKYNLLQAKKENQDTLLSFGGAYSNHIAAVSYSGIEYNFKKTIGIIRGEELKEKTDINPTLKFAKKCGMQLEFITREEYRRKAEPDFIEALRQRFGAFYYIPEGGTNELAVRGCEEILSQKDEDFDYICCPVGTGGTLSGLINSATKSQTILGFPAVRDQNLKNIIGKFTKSNKWELITEYHFGGFGKVTSELIAFINKFYTDYKIPLDPIYTGKMTFGIVDLIQKGYFPRNSKILMIHTGGLQGISGMNIKLSKNNNKIILNT